MTDAPNAPDERISPLTGGFVDPRLEAAFRAHVWPEWSGRLRFVSLLGAGVVVAFGFTDWLALGFGPELYACWTARLAVLGGALVLGALTRGEPDVARLDAMLLLLMLLFTIALLVAAALVGRGVLLVTPSVTLIVLSFFLFAPARFEVQLTGSVAISAGFLALAAVHLQPSTAEMINATLLIVVCAGLGAFTAVRTHALQRREYASLRHIQRRARFEEMIARLSTRLITLPAGAASGQAIGTALAEVGEFTDVDRTYVFEFDLEQRLASCTHEWCRAGIAPAMRALQRVPFDEFGWGVRELLAGRSIGAARLEDLPPEAGAERAEARRHGVRSLLVLPLVSGSQVLGAIGFHAVRAPLRLDEDLAATLRMIGEMISGVLVRRRSHAALEHQARTLEASVAALEKSNAELQQFAYVASHDLQEPLRTISSFSSLLASRYPREGDPQAAEYLSYLTAAAGRMHALITNLLDYSRLDTRASPFVACDLEQVIGEARENLRASIEDIGATITVGPLPRVYGDPAQLVQLFQNLIGNALKFHGPDPPAVLISADRAGESWRFSVADNGIGIDPKHAPRLFQVFSRLHTQDQYPGTGIGLAICRRIVERHRGRIWVEPRLPRGSVFRFTLPVAG